MTFGVDGVFVFQGVKSGVIQQIFNGWAPHSTRVHCIAHGTNLAVQILSHLQMVNKIEGLFQTLYNYFSKNLKMHLEIYEACIIYGNERGNFFEECENPLDIYVVPCSECDAIVHNFVDEDGRWWYY